MTLFLASSEKLGLVPLLGALASRFGALVTNPGALVTFSGALGSRFGASVSRFGIKTLITRTIVISILIQPHEMMNLMTRHLLAS